MKDASPAPSPKRRDLSIDGVDQAVTGPNSRQFRTPDRLSRFTAGPGATPSIIEEERTGEMTHSPARLSPTAMYRMAPNYDSSKIKRGLVLKSPVMPKLGKESIFSVRNDIMPMVFPPMRPRPGVEVPPVNHTMRPAIDMHGRLVLPIGGERPSGQQLTDQIRETGLPGIDEMLRLASLPGLGTPASG